MWKGEASMNDESSQFGDDPFQVGRDKDSGLSLSLWKLKSLNMD